MYKNNIVQDMIQLQKDRDKAFKRSISKPKIKGREEICQSSLQKIQKLLLTFFCCNKK